VLASEINRVRSSLFNWSATKEQQRLPEPSGPCVTLTEKLFVPLHEHPDVSVIHFVQVFSFFLLNQYYWMDPVFCTDWMVLQTSNHASGWCQWTAVVQ